VIAGVVGGAGVITIGAAVVVGLGAKRDFDDVIENECGGDRRNCTPSGFEHATDARSRGNVATIVAGVGIAAVATAAILWWTAPREARATVTPVVTRDALGLAVGGAF
jgi:hypothetical protein